MRATKKRANTKHSWKNILYVSKLTWFFSECFLSPEINSFFVNRQQSISRAGQKKTHVFFSNARPKCNGRAHLKHRKKHIVAYVQINEMNRALGHLCAHIG